MKDSPRDNKTPDTNGQCPRIRHHQYDTTKWGGCPFCSGHELHPADSLKARNPEVAAKYDASGLNSQPSDQTPGGSAKKGHFRCEHGEIYTRKILDECNNERGCSCAKKLAFQMPELASYYSSENSKPFREATPVDRVIWKCAKCGHPFEQRGSDRKRTKGLCPICANRISAGAAHSAAIAAGRSVSDVMPFWAMRLLSSDPKSVSAGSPEPHWWRCACGAKFKTSPAKLSWGIRVSCAECSEHRHISMAEAALGAELQAIFKTLQLSADVEGSIRDYYLAERRLVIEYDGQNCHCSPEQIANDRKQSTRLVKAGYFVLRLREDYPGRPPLPPLSVPEVIELHVPFGLSAQFKCQIHATAVLTILFILAHWPRQDDSAIRAALEEYQTHDTMQHLEAYWTRIARSGIPPLEQSLYQVNPTAAALVRKANPKCLWPGSSKTVKAVCPDCGKERTITVRKLVLGQVCRPCAAKRTWQRRRLKKQEEILQLEL